MTKTRLAALAAALLLPLPAQALDPVCDDVTTQAGMNDCAYDDWQTQDALLNDAYAEAMALLKNWDADLPANLQGGADKLREGQRAWITYRDAACAAEGYAMRGGSAEPLLVYGCMARLTESRTKDLQDMVAAYR
ncbi:lysozyme inhibitor LprI family protein [Neotabrizicola sp. sgz301269]|uniref:lysozyme inhibitor LprI family protein n=1 Tax=Neotabrizicola sp. sgz301269 TaxID=3276282 RepID=UPI0037706B76